MRCYPEESQFSLCLWFSSWFFTIPHQKVRLRNFLKLMDKNRFLKCFIRKYMGNGNYLTALHRTQVLFWQNEFEASYSRKLFLFILEIYFIAFYFREGYSRNAPCSLYVISTFLFKFLYSKIFPNEMSNKSRCRCYIDIIFTLKFPTISA